MAECEAAFRAARAADPAFALSRAEAGHPMWGPVYQRAARTLIAAGVEASTHVKAVPAYRGPAGPLHNAGADELP